MMIATSFLSSVSVALFPAGRGLYIEDTDEIAQREFEPSQIVEKQVIIPLQFFTDSSNIQNEELLFFIGYERIR